MVFQWFPMVANHWSDDGMVTIHRSGLMPFGNKFSCPYLFSYSSSCIPFAELGRACLFLFNVWLLYPGWLQREGPPVGGSLVDRLPHHRRPASPLLRPPHLFPTGAAFTTLLRVVLQFWHLCLFSRDCQRPTQMQVKRARKQRWKQFLLFFF